MAIVKPLQPIGVWVLETVVVDLLQLDFNRRAIRVVLVGRITGPVARGREDFTDEESVGGKIRGHDVDNLASGVATTSDLKPAIFGTNKARLETLARRCAGVGKLGANVGCHGKRGARRQIQRVWVIGEDAASWPERHGDGRGLPAGVGHATTTSEQHQTALRRTRVVDPWFAWHDLTHREVHEPPARPRTGDLNRGAGAT